MAIMTIPKQVEDAEDELPRTPTKSHQHHQRGHQSTITTGKAIMRFDKPLFQTLAMLAAMLPIQHSNMNDEQTQLPPLQDKNAAANSDNYQSVNLWSNVNNSIYGLYQTDSLSLRRLRSMPQTNESKALSTKTYLTLALLSIFDLTATALCAVGLSSQHSASQRSRDLTGTLLGVTFMLAASLIMLHDAVKVPPLLLFGMEGVGGFVFRLFVFWPAGYWLHYCTRIQ
jgi:hypothetical protein